VEDLPIRCLVTLRSAIPLIGFSNPKIVVICTGTPQSKFYLAAFVVITHALHGRVIRVPASGTPLICMPIGRDQPGNTARVVLFIAKMPED
jgi:hypothetical protein